MIQAIVLFWGLSCQLTLTTSQTELKTGELIPRIVAKNVPDQDYCLYLPAHYSSDQKWPTIIVFDPEARASQAVGNLIQVAETFGYVVASSNQARDLDWPGQSRALDAVWEDMRERLKLDPFRLTLVGLGESARACADFALLTKRPSAIVLCHAGLGTRHKGNLERSDLALVSITSTVGPNGYELDALHRQLDELGWWHHAVSYQGEYGWPTAAAFMDAFDWLQLQAVTSGLASAKIPTNPSRERLLDRLNQWVESGNILNARDLAASLARLYPNELQWQELIETQESDPRFQQQRRAQKEHHKRESNLVKKQAKRMERVLRGPMKSNQREKELNWWQMQIASARAIQAGPESTPHVRRLLANIIYECTVASLSASNRQDWETSCFFAEIAALADPKSPQLQLRLARAWVQTGDSTRALETLKRAIELGLVPDEFANDPQLLPLHDHAQWQELIDHEVSPTANE
ncbi:MAG: hypothetical protein KDC35_17770 [Acidobacteria bacterium]|nr:hypothetical protein [Acidobacteriota bacterium]